MISVSEHVIKCGLGGAGAYLIGWFMEREANRLNSITRVNQLKDLAQLLDAGTPLFVEVSGRIGSDKPINCETSDLKALVLDQTKVQVYLMKQKNKKSESRTWVKDPASYQEQEQNDASSSEEDSKEQKQNARSSEEDSTLVQEQIQTETSSWVKDSVSLHSRLQEVNDWYLDDGTGRVNVVGALGLKPTVVSEAFEESGRCGTPEPDCRQDLKMLGIRKVERILPTGTPLRVVGKAVKDAVGSIEIRQPSISHSTIDEQIAEFGIMSRLFKYTSVGVTVLGIYLLGRGHGQD